MTVSIGRMAVVAMFGILLLGAPRAKAQEAEAEGHHEEGGAYEPVAEPPLPPPEAPPAPPTRPKSVIFLDLALHVGTVTGADLVSFSPLLNASIQVHDHVAIEATIALPYASLSYADNTSGSAAVITNPWIAGYYTGALGKFKLRIGAGLGLPTASLPTVNIADPQSVRDGVAAGKALAEGGAVRGVWVPWLWAVDYLSIGVPATIATTVAPNVKVVGDIGFVYLVYTGDNPAKSNRTFARAGLAASYTAGIVEAGLRLQAIWFPSDDGDNAQIAIEPYALFNFGVPFVRVGLLMNLDEPRGFAFGENHTWGLHVAAGAAF